VDAFKTIQTFTRVISWEINTTATIENITTKYYVYQNDKIITIRQTGSRNLMGSKNASHDMGYLYEACDQISDFCHQ
jgi:hypothetical protein